MSIQVKVDFNSMGHGGLVRASQRRADGTLVEGAKVVAVDPYEHMAHVAVVERLEPDGKAWLRIDWDAALPTSFEFQVLSDGYHQRTSSAALNTLHQGGLSVEQSATVAWK